MERPVVFKSGGYDIFGVVHIPPRASAYRPVPVVVFCHGFTGTKVEPHRIFVKTARRLERERIASLRFDFRGCGDSGGEFVDMAFSDFVEDAMKAISYVTGFKGIVQTRVGLVGFSLGGAIASYVSARNLRIKALAMWAPAANLKEKAEDIKQQEEIKIKRIIHLRAVDYRGNLIGRRFAKELPKINSLKEIEGYRGNAILLHGTKDKTVPLSHSLNYARILKRNGVPVERFLIEGADHLFSSYMWEQTVIKKTVRFFTRVL